MLVYICNIYKFGYVILYYVLWVCDFIKIKYFWILKNVCMIINFVKNYFLSKYLKYYVIRKNYFLSKYMKYYVIINFKCIYYFKILVI